MKSAVFALANNEEHANRILDRLSEAGFSAEEVSVLFADKSGYARQVPSTEMPSRDRTARGGKAGTLGHEKHTKAPEGATTGALAGGLIGGSIGLLAGIGALAIPGLGAFIAAGPLMAALSGSAVGGSLGLLVGALAGMGIPEYEAKKYQNSLEKGHVLVCVHVENSRQIDMAKDILQKEGAKDISTTREIAGHSA